MSAIIVFDYETGGLDPYAGDEPIELAAVALDPKTLEEIGRFPARTMWVVNLDKVSPEALKVNNKTLGDIHKGENPLTVHKEFIDWAKTFIDHNVEKPKRNILAGHNVQFDIGFLRNTINRWWTWLPVEDRPTALNQVFDYHTVCTANLAYTKKILTEGALTSVSLGNLTKFYNIPHEAHTAMGDVEATAELLRALISEMRNERAAYNEPIKSV